jgi:uncharacterized protein YodC (DUF2158 family)
MTEQFKTMTEQFKLGDTVRLRSGGPVMTINEKAQGGAGPVCVWFADDDVKHHAFKPEALELAGRPVDAISADD